MVSLSPSPTERRRSVGPETTSPGSQSRHWYVLPTWRADDREGWHDYSVDEDR